MIVCTGALGCILITKWTRLRPKITFFELGSVLNPEFGFRALACHRQVRDSEGRHGRLSADQMTTERLRQLRRCSSASNCTLYTA